MNIPKINFISGDYWPDYGGYENEKNITEATNVMLLYGGFIFSEGNWVIEVKQDPEHYYTGEEFALAIRSFTYGYDIYLPSQIVAWHRTHTATPKKHFNTNTEDVARRKHSHAMNRLKLLIEGGDLGEYGVGNVRTIDQYAELTGIDFKNKKLINV